MVWVPEGALVAGTPEGRVPRLADQEMPGQQLVLHGFFIDLFAYPNEEGAIPHTGVTQARGGGRVRRARASAVHRARVGAGVQGPGELDVRVRRSLSRRRVLDGPFAAHATEWLSARVSQRVRRARPARRRVGVDVEPLGSRRRSKALIALRGGNGEAGDVVGRCANAVPRAATGASPTLGFRCCMGEVNEAGSPLRIDRGKSLETRAAGSSAAWRRGSSPCVPEAVEPRARRLRAAGTRRCALGLAAHQQRAFLVGGGCAGNARAQRCGVLVAEVVSGQAQFMAWVWSGIWPATVRTSTDSRSKLWVYGGDATSQLRQAVGFEAGRLRLGEVQRRFSAGAEWKARPVRTSEGAPAAPASSR